MQLQSSYNGLSAYQLALKTLVDGLVQEPDSTLLVDWKPFPDKPQEKAFYSDADIIGYGGAAGGGKTDLLIGKAITRFRRARIFRRNYTDLADIVDRGNAILNGVTSFVWGTKRAWQLPDGRQVRLGAVEHEKDLRKFRGRPSDFIGIDEATEFPERFVRFLMGWLRTDSTDIKPQVMLTFNPPMTAEGEWVVEFFKPWLDPKHPNPAKDGELRWFINVKERDIEVGGPETVVIDNEEYTPKSRTFFHAYVQDNPVYMATGYDKQLNSLPEPLRSQLKGDFSIRLSDDRYQVIPTLWVLLANQRYEQGQRPTLKQRALACDVARGGTDETTVATLHGNWFEVYGVPGVDTPNGDSVADFIGSYHEDDAPVVVDVIGVGSSAYDSAVKRFSNVVGFVAGASSDAVDASGKYGFANLRSEAWWMMREALDPENEEAIALPPNPKLRADLTAPRYSVVGAKYKVESKDDIYKRLGRSTDYGDVVVMAWQHVNAPEPERMSFEFSTDLFDNWG